MLIPHGQGNTRSLNLYAIQLYSLVSVFAVLSFIAAFSFQTVRAANKDIERLEREKREIGAQAAPPIQAPAAVLSEEERGQIEQKVREEYEARMAAITSELSELYDVEKNFRKNNGLPPRNKKAAGYVENVSSEAGGKGGAPGVSPDDVVPVDTSNDSLMRPPTVIEGLANPGADLIVQEIDIRTDSLRQYNEAYLAASDETRDKIDRTPGNLPVLVKYVKTSRFGYRKDPFTRDLSFHDGLDISAPYGTSVVATGKGKIIFSGWDKYYGNCVRIDHGKNADGKNMVTVYGHLQKTTAQVGDVVNKGTEVGKLGSTGRSTGAHVHYEVRIDGKAVDPERYL